MDARIRGWTAAILIGASLWGIHLFTRFLELSSMVQGRFGGFIRFSVTASLIVLAILLVALAAAWRRLRVRHWEILAAALFAFLVIAPAIGKTTGRLLLGPRRMILDSILQVEVASGMLAQGRNPYVEEYFGTELEVWNWSIDRPAMHHLVYPPLPVLLTLPVRELFVRTVGGYDSRFLLLPMMIATFVLAWRAWRGHEWRAAALALVFFNPLLLSDFHVGRWDMLILFLWTFALRSALAGKPAGMAVWLALAALTKTTLLATALAGVITCCRTRREGARWLAVYGGVFLAVFLPFFLWNPKEMYLDLFASLQGLGPHPYDIVSGGALGFSGVVLAAGWAASPQAYFPFWIFQIPATLAVAAAAIRHQARDRSLTAMAGAFAAIVATYLYFNRCSDPAWFGSLISMVVLAAGYDRASHPCPPRADPEKPSPAQAAAGY